MPNLANLKGGSRKGKPNKVTRELKEMIRAALDEAGGVDYLVKVSASKPEAFLSLVGKILPHDINANVTATVSLPSYLADVWRRRANQSVD